MKKVFCVLLVFLFSFSFAQMKITEFSDTNLIGKIRNLSADEINLYKHDNRYTFIYNAFVNKGETVSGSFYFDDVDGNDFDAFYNTVIKGFNNKPVNDIIIELPDYKISLQYSKSVSSNLLQIIKQDRIPTLDGTILYSHVKHSSYLYNKKQIQKLFGKD